MFLIEMKSFHFALCLLFQTTIVWCASTTSHNNVTISTTGCSCYFENKRKDCACCDYSQGDVCQCPHMVWPSQCAKCADISTTCPNDYNCTVGTYNGCIQPQTVKFTYSQAQKFCRLKISHGANEKADFFDISPSIQDRIKRYNLEKKRIWTGVSVIDHQWRWILNSKTTPTELQGCFTLKSHLSSIILGTNYTASDPTMTVSKCIKQCKDRKNKLDYASVGLERLSDNTESVTCTCSRDFWPQQVRNDTVTEEPEEMCHTTCPSDATQFCGGYNYTYLVFNTKGKNYTNFIPNADVNSTNCGTLSSSKRMWLKRECTYQNNIGFVCDIPNQGSRSCLRNPNRRLLNNRKCISIHDSYNLNWFQASEECARMNGHLILLDRQHLEIELLQILDTYTSVSEWWIGVTNRALVWSDRSPMESYSSPLWAPGEPDITTDKHCAIVDTGLNYTWYLTGCNDLNEFYCEIKRDECVSMPCQNGGTCINDNKNYKCQCAPMWTGDNCQSLLSNQITTPTTTNNETMTPVIVGTALAVLAVVTVIILILLLLYRHKSKKISRELSAIKKSKKKGGHSMIHRIASIFTIYEKIEEERSSSFRRLPETSSPITLAVIEEPPEVPFRQSSQTVSSTDNQTKQNCDAATNIKTQDEQNPSDGGVGYQGLVKRDTTESSDPAAYQRLDAAGYETLQTELKTIAINTYAKLNSTDKTSQEDDKTGEDEEQSRSQKATETDDNTDTVSTENIEITDRNTGVQNKLEELENTEQTENQNDNVERQYLQILKHISVDNAEILV